MVSPEYVTEDISFAGNADQEIIPTAGYKIKIMSILMKIVCNATAGNRNIQLTHKKADDTVIFYELILETHIVASQTKYCQWSPKMGIGDWSDVDMGTQAVNTLPETIAPLLLDKIHDTNKLVIDIRNGLAGDTVTGVITYQKVRLDGRFDE